LPDKNDKNENSVNKNQGWNPFIKSTRQMRTQVNITQKTKNKKQNLFLVLFLIRVIKHSRVWLMIYCSIFEEHHLPLKIVKAKLTKEKERGK
jgi:hypothetical protein